MAERPQDIRTRWTNEGREFRPRDVLEEWKQQGIDDLRQREDRILAAESGTYPDDVVTQVRDYRDAGHYTTLGGVPRSE